MQAPVMKQNRCITFYVGRETPVKIHMVKHISSASCWYCHVKRLVFVCVLCIVVHLGVCECWSVLYFIILFDFTIRSLRVYIVSF